MTEKLLPQEDDNVIMLALLDTVKHLRSVGMDEHADIANRTIESMRRIKQLQKDTFIELEELKILHVALQDSYIDAIKRINETRRVKMIGCGE